MLLCPTLQYILWLCTLFPLSLAFPWHATTTYALTVINSVAQPPTFENIATRHNGQLLLTSTASPKLYQVDPFHKDAMISVADIPYSTGLLGIVELEEDIFYVVSANLSSPIEGVPSSNAVWKVDMRDHGLSFGSNKTAKTTTPVSLVANITRAQLLNGICRLAHQDEKSLLIADSQAGVIFKLDAHTGSYQEIINDDALKNSPGGLQVAVNGIHVRGSHLFFTNLNKGIFGRIPVSLSTGLPTGPIEVIIDGIHGDDFVVSSDGQSAWIAMNGGQNSLLKVDIPGKSAQVVVESSYLASASSVSVGRTLFDRDSLYISSAGIFNAAPGSNLTVAGGIVARVDIRKGR
ncbi:uncharacterized protein N7446_007695 [Penicillium canescens]|uniref:uncharacterized protein n=1 Tax=Penicillium canescens TaxID=5083 RepID=UPI0026DECCEF|nr:uncharacterized protein N7446_007695 [Penicillium canescens]KAJ6034008.1 hypothetical protein N7444_011779 [Penicillium canescens]KAJ6058112.1 hypothetical protein N7446_007695 [Penicillium canescens]